MCTAYLKKVTYLNVRIFVCRGQGHLHVAMGQHQMYQLRWLDLEVAMQIEVKGPAIADIPDVLQHQP